MKANHSFFLANSSGNNISGTARAAQYRPSAQNPSASSSDAAVPTTPDQKEVSGSILKVDIRVGVLTINTRKDEEMKFTVDANTIINLMGTSGKLENLKPGQQVVVSAKEDKALSIEEIVTRTPYSSSQAGQRACPNPSGPKPRVVGSICSR